LVALESAQNGSVHVCHFAVFGPTKQKLLNLELFSSFKIKKWFLQPPLPNSIEMGDRPSKRFNTLGHSDK
jgi:hypothetical protein